MRINYAINTTVGLLVVLFAIWFFSLGVAESLLALLVFELYIGLLLLADIRDQVSKRQ